MAKLGERLIAAGRLLAEQLDEALRAQVLWGGRIGTNLVDLEYVDLDDISNELSRQRQLPVATREEFERANADLQKKLPAALAEFLQIVPLAHTADGRTAIACMTPPRPMDAVDIASSLGVRPNQLAFSIAAELRVRYYLERVYGIDRPSRFLRIRNDGNQPRMSTNDILRQTHDVALATPPPIDVLDADLDLTLDDEPTEDLTDEIHPLELATDGDYAATPIEEASAQSERHYLPVIDEAQPAAATLGRMTLKRKVIAAALEAPPPETLPDALRAIRRGNDRNMVAKLALETLRTHGAKAYDFGALFIVRDETAIGWMCTEADFDISAVAVSLAGPSMLTQARQSPLHLAPQDPRLSKLDTRLLAALGADTSVRISVAPVIIGKYLLCYLVALGNGIPPEGEALIDDLSGAVGHAFLRLIRAANR